MADLAVVLVIVGGAAIYICMKMAVTMRGGDCNCGGKNRQGYSECAGCGVIHPCVNRPSAISQGKPVSSQFNESRLKDG